MTTLDLHIGVHKTGTSSLQSFFVHNTEPLKRASIIYPVTGRIGKAHYKISQSARSGADLELIFSMLAEESSGFSHALVSSEDLSHSFLDRAKLDKFCQAAKKYFHIRFILYLRRQDELKESVFAQVSKDWYVGNILDENHYEYDYMKRVNILREQVEKHDLFVRLYKRRIENRGIEDDFLSIYNLSALAGFERVAPENASLGRAITALLSRIEKRGLENRHDFPRYLATCGLWQKPDPGCFMSLQERVDFLSRYKDSNRAVAEEFFPELNGELFDAPVEETNWLPITPPSERDYLRLVTKLWNDYVRVKRERDELRNTRK